MKLNWNYLGGEGGGGKTENLLWGEYGYFLELHNDSSARSKYSKEVKTGETYSYL